MGKDTKDKNKGIAGLLLLFGWLLFILLVLLFYFYFKDNLTFLNKNNNDTEAASNTPQEYQSSYSYETNSNLDINALIIEYFAALTVCDQAKLQSLVTDPTEFNNMDDYKRKAQAITKYSNINCYTLPGYDDNATLVYVTCNLNIANVTSTPMDIKRFYVLKTDTGYVIQNGTLDASVTDYINQQTASDDIQELYVNVKNNIDYCIENDPDFAEFYNQINTSE